MSKLIALAVAAVTLAVSGISPVTRLQAQTWRTLTSARQLGGTDPVDVQVHYGVGTLKIDPADDGMLYRMELRYDEETFEPLIDYDAEDRELELGVESIGHGRRMNVREGASATISLTRNLPLDLDLEFGAGEAEIELGGMMLRNVAIATGASDTQIRFGRPNRMIAESVSIQAGAADLRVIGLGNTRAREVEFEGGVGATVLDFSGAVSDMDASVEMGVGSVTLRLPRKIGVKLTRSSFLSSFDGGGLEKRGDGYFSSNWSNANARLTIDVSAALGSIEIEWVD